jgi:hypothetical protein
LAGAELFDMNCVGGRSDDRTCRKAAPYAPAAMGARRAVDLARLPDPAEAHRSITTEHWKRTVMPRSGWVDDHQDANTRVIVRH